MCMLYAWVYRENNTRDPCEHRKDLPASPFELNQRITHQNEHGVPKRPTSSR